MIGAKRVAKVLRSPIALATVVVLTLSACSGAGETVLGDGEPEILGERESNRSSIACEADSEGLYEQDFSSETLGEEFEYFVTRDWDLWEEGPEFDREELYSLANSADLILDSEGSRTFVSLNEPEDLLKYSPNGAIRSAAPMSTNSLLISGLRLWRASLKMMMVAELW